MAETAHDPGQKIDLASGYSTYLRVYKPESWNGSVVQLVPGWGDTKETFDGVPVGTLLDEGFCVITADHVNATLGVAPDSSVKDEAYTMEAGGECVAEIGRRAASGEFTDEAPDEVVIVGHSMGTTQAVRAAAEKNSPYTKAALIAPAMGKPGGVTKLLTYSLVSAALRSERVGNMYSWAARRLPAVVAAAKRFGEKPGEFSSEKKEHEKRKVEHTGKYRHAAHVSLKRAANLVGDMESGEGLEAISNLPSEFSMCVMPAQHDRTVGNAGPLQVIRRAIGRFGKEKHLDEGIVLAEEGSPGHYPEGKLWKKVAQFCHLPPKESLRYGDLGALAALPRAPQPPTERGPKDGPSGFVRAA